MKLNLKTILILFVCVVLTPILINIIIAIPSYGLAKSNTDNWLTFFGNYSGGIIGGIVAYIIAKTQIDHDKDERQRESQEKEKFAFLLVENFLYDEIRNNLAKVPLGGLKELSKGNNHVTYSIGAISFEYDIYNDLKFELVKYNNPIVRDTINLYKQFKQFEKFPVLNLTNIDQEKALKFYEEFNNWNIRLHI